jgi:acetyl esterase/lipase
VYTDNDMTTVVYKTVGDLDIKADVYPVISAKPAPVLVLIHGGALMMGSRTGIRPALHFLCACAGFAQVSIDYRLAPETKLPAIIEDLQDAFRWVRGDGARRFYFDPERVGVIGWSAGGYLTLMSGCCVEPRPQALVSYYGYGDIAGPWYSEPDPHYCKQPLVSRDAALAAVGAAPITDPPPGNDRFQFYLYCRQNGSWPNEVMGIDPHAQPRAFDPYCPVRNVTKDYPRTLLFHGTNDTDVPHQQSVDMAAALAQAGVFHDLVSISGGGHGFDGGVQLNDMQDLHLKPGAAAFERTVSFLQQYV